MPAWTAGRIEQKAGQASRPKWRSGFQREQDRWMSFVVVREKKKLFSVKTRLERSFGWPWLATTVQPRQITFALVDAWVQALQKDVEHLFVSPTKNIKFCL